MKEKCMQHRGLSGQRSEATDKEATDEEETDEEATDEDQDIGQGCLPKLT